MDHVEFIHAVADIALARLPADERKRLRVVVMGAPLAVRRVPEREARYMQPLDYPLRRALRRFRAAGRRLGIDRNARRFLRD